MLLVVALVAAGAPASAAPPKTALVSKTSAGIPANGDSLSPSASSTGRFVAFKSDATNLPGRDAYTDIYVRDRETGRTRLVSKTSGGDPADGASHDPSISASGRFVAFQSYADNLPGDDAQADVYVHDRETGRTRLVSKTSGGDPADDDSGNPAISATGRFVAFQSDATNLPGDIYGDVYVHDRQTGRTSLASKSSAEAPANADSSQPSISTSGRFVAFNSNATNLPGRDAYSDVYVRDRRTGRTALVSKTSGGNPANDYSHTSQISPSGRFVAFQSIADNLPGRDAYWDVYVHDRETGRTRLVSESSRGIPANEDSYQPSISASGRIVAFESEATNLPGRDAHRDVYVHDRETGRTRLASKSSQGVPANEGSFHPSISASGRFVAFHSNATNLPGRDAYADVYVHGPLR
jgi:hypothetical protein